jgi:pimeloyl-ACP methyl ester carboxylesterase
MAEMKAILLHGAWQGRWVWEQMAPLLAAGGIEPHALDLPGNGTDDVAPSDVSLDLYVAAVLEQIEALGGRASIVAHSGSGVVASQVAETCPDRVTSLAYIAGMMLPNGVSYAELIAAQIKDEPEASGIGPHLVWSADRSVSEVPVEAARHFFFHDCPPDLADTAARRLTPQPERGRAVRPRISAERFGRVRRFYIGAQADRSVVPSIQRRMLALVPGTEMTTLETGHAPHIAAPKKLADCLIPWLRHAA